jgi:hypothetical protein
VDALIQFFRQNPVLLMVALVWLAGIVGNIAKAAKRARERAAAAQRPAPMPVREPESQRAQRAERAERAGGEPARGDTMTERSAEDVAREMRRILGVEVEPATGDRSTTVEPAPRSSSPPQLPPQRAHRERLDHGEAAARAAAAERRAQAERAQRAAELRARRAAERERERVQQQHREQRERELERARQRAPEPLARKLPTHIDPHVGESIQRRGTVQSGRVGSPRGHELGSLGGRVQHTEQRHVRAQRYALHDLKRVIVLNEILGPPLALRRAERLD